MFCILPNYLYLCRMIIETPPKPKTRPHGNPEAKIQADCFYWLNNTHPKTRGLYFCVPNENSRSVYENKKQQLISGAKRRSMGVFAGVSDSVLLIPRGRYHGACVEFKIKTGRQSEAQIRWQQLVEMQGYYYVVVRSLDEFKEFIDWYLSL